MFSLAMAGKGFVVDLNNISDACLRAFSDWFIEAAKEEKAQIDAIKAGRMPQ